MLKQLRNFSALFTGILFVLITSSCGTGKKSVYFSDIGRDDVSHKASAEYFEPLIQTDDILTVNIQTIDPRATSAVNQAGGTTGNSNMGPNDTAPNGFLVDKEGFIEMPMLGMIKVADMSTSEAKEVIRKKASTYYKNPTIQVRFANFKITVLGEVARPASYTIPNEKISVLDAISLAGDLTIFGKRDDVMLIRNNGAYKEIARLNLNSSELMSSPYFYLKQNDVLYIEPNKAKISTNNAPKFQIITIAIAAATLIITEIERF
jgi:polysaccharide export outer membrane protein